MKYEQALKECGFNYNKKKTNDSILIEFTQNTPINENWKEQIIVKEDTQKEFKDKLHQRIVYFYIEEGVEPYLNTIETGENSEETENLLKNEIWKKEKLQEILYKIS